MADYSHTCKRCGCTFHAGRKTRIYCSVKCRSGARHGNSDKCYNCGAATTDGKLFCTKECAHAHSNRMAYRRRRKKLST